jgi:hypothetical protein
MSNTAQRIAERIDARLGDNGRKWKNEFVAMVVHQMNLVLILGR